MMESHSPAQASYYGICAGNEPRNQFSINLALPYRENTMLVCVCVFVCVCVCGGGGLFLGLVVWLGVCVSKPSQGHFGVITHYLKRTSPVINKLPHQGRLLMRKPTRFRCHSFIARPLSTRQDSPPSQHTHTHTHTHSLLPNPVGWQKQGRLN